MEVEAGRRGTYLPQRGNEDTTGRARNVEGQGLSLPILIKSGAPTLQR